MSRHEVTVVDYGVGNLLSVTRGLEHCGAEVSISSDPDAIRIADRVVLPGVGAFANGMSSLAAGGLTDVMIEVARKGNPVLGICLGMQMLLDFSEEFGVTQGLGLIPGAVTSIPETSATGEHLKVPHIGWAGLVAASGSWDDSILKGIAQEESMYFVHSYVANPYLAAHRIADCLYGGHVLAAVIACDNVMGCQFHPEKSGEAGLGVLRNFLTR